ncbi:BppU family phage baseplate upper protein [Mammaliicoccus sciuri]|uniref:BppU family phage baseplate upper protein n=1 Tax=Mammaliicoccus sciuri TaxID=1296 RepID=UPI002DBD26BC|nr:BppU family phage baseplate upper protein [Mammaliicoccus sciuri]MEB6233803.1 hypothetical protein [Mammaliicoccus sciuri]
MVNGINKIGTFNLKVEPYLKPISDLGIGFYNLDENTATLRFQLNNSAGSLLISDENLKVYGYFESSNGSVSDVIELEIIDELNGIAEITLDKDFLHASTSTKVTGQLYIGINNVSGKPEYNEVAVLGEFTFEVADALINKVSSFTKIEYIRMFSQLKQKIEQQVKDIQEAIENGSDYVVEMNNVKDQAITQINKTVTEGKAYIDSLILQSEINFNETTTNVISEIKTTKDNAISTIDNKSSEKVDEVKSISNNAIKHVDDKLVEFNTKIEENSFVQPADLDNKINGLNWQKYKLTNDDGTVKFLNMNGNLEDYRNLPPGEYYTANTPVAISGVSTAGFTTVEQREGSIKRITYRPYNSAQIWQMRYYQSWFDWERVDFGQTDTGWINFNLINGALSNTAYTSDNGFKCSYRTIVSGSETKRIVRINGTNLAHNQVIAQLPANFVKNTQAFPVRVPAGAYTGYVVFRTSGEVTFVLSGDRSAWNDTGYAYGECSWND